MSRIDDLARLYALLGRLERHSGGKRSLAQLAPSRFWPKRGVYFFFEQGEVRTGSGNGPRLVRIGTHALAAGSRSTLHQRLKNHAGTSSGMGGNHRGSIFRLLVGQALIRRGKRPACLSWGFGSDPSKAAKEFQLSREVLLAAEQPIEAAVSAYLGTMQFLWLPIDDEAGPDSLRGLIERNVIALATNFHGQGIDPASSSWLGLSSGRERVRRSGLWNQRHVEDEYDPGSLGIFDAAIERAFPNPPRVSGPT